MHKLHVGIARRGISLVLILTVAGCADDATAPTDPGPPPDLPPLTTMSGDFSIFGTPDALP